MQTPPRALSTPSPGIKASPGNSVSRSHRDCGIGVQLVKCPSGDIEVLAVREGSNAGEAGVYAGDRLVSVNGSDVSGLDCLQVGMT
jgi:C-terminal processing protease CtpA/Prc